MADGKCGILGQQWVWMKKLKHYPPLHAHLTDAVVLKGDYSIRYQMCLVVLALLHYILCFAVNNHVRLTCISHGCICTVICCYWYVFTYFVAYLHGHIYNACRWYLCTSSFDLLFVFLFVFHLFIYFLYICYLLYYVDTF